MRPSSVRPLAIVTVGNRGLREGLPQTDGEPPIGGFIDPVAKVGREKNGIIAVFRACPGDRDGAAAVTPLSSSPDATTACPWLPPNRSVA